MKTTIESLLLVCLLAVLLLLSGCALLDGLLGETETHLHNDAGQPLYIDAAGNETTAPVDASTGKPNPPLTIKTVNPDGAAGAASWLSSFGPWGALLGTLTTFGAGLYARVRNKQRLKEAGARRQAESQLDLAHSAEKFLVRLIEQIKQGDAVDANKDGKVDLKEIQEWVRRQGGKFTDPAYLQRLVNEANGALG
ncbi:MAG: hypothetical protein KIT75_03525 [Planctomycetota bacterium]|nr:hypothetical protein [Planctomycetota bacterium]